MVSKLVIGKLFPCKELCLAELYRDRAANRYQWSLLLRIDFSL